MTKLMFLGDTHGFTDKLEKQVRFAAKAGVTKIVVVGDFGFTWKYDDRLQKVENVLNQFSVYGIQLYWLDGNHEDFDYMKDIGADTKADEMVQLTPHVTYLPRGFAWEWDGIRFMSLGGAYSVDKDRREPHVSWWPQETITEGDLMRVAEQGEVDVLLTHDAPAFDGKLEWWLHKGGPYAEFYGEEEAHKMDVDSRRNRQAVTAAVQITNPKLLIHGHYHYRYNDLMNDTLIVGLDRDGKGVRQRLILDTEDIWNTEYKNLVESLKK